MTKLGPKEAQRRELRRRVAAEAIEHQRRPVLEDLPEGVTRGMPPEPPNSPAGAQVPASAPIPAAADIFSDDLNKRLEAMRDPALIAVAESLGITVSELCASLRYYTGHKRAVAARKKRLRAAP